MYKKKIPLDLDCGVAVAMEVMGGKWKSCILYELEKGCKRPSELHRHFEDTSPRVINQQLKELERHGMIRKKIYPEMPPRVEYFITDKGLTLIPIIRMLEEWGNNFRPRMQEILKQEK
ncbi:winged helix-turn-helix transcriptional regulator [Phocaeicola sp.]|uniref:winged helix-turn-helix transcriptional regulator n=1 Tax=Phocaeicola sp. TaxID=2773926 RepID=UPI003AB8BF2B